MPDTSLNCDIGGTWYRSGNYAGCCSTTGASWNTGFIYENTDDSNLRTDIFCGISSLNWRHPTLNNDPELAPNTHSHPHRNSNSNLHRPRTTTLPYLRSRPKKHTLNRRRRRPGLPAQPRWLRHLVRLDHPTRKASERGSSSGSGPFKPAAAAASVVCAVSTTARGRSSTAAAAGRANEGCGAGSWAAAVCGGVGGRSEVVGEMGEGRYARWGLDGDVKVVGDG